MYLNIHERIKIRHTFPKESDENAPYDELDINELAVWVARTWAFFAEDLNDACRWELFFLWNKRKIMQFYENFIIFFVFIFYQAV